ncbi:MAG: NAD-dependent epimerase/dehydratase family protein [Deltaproteobacteria bacterium]|nr:MAG: NAD-dependent epimerase/dehydratase family protein [Deltaproteobacteria bacterium]
MSKASGARSERSYRVALTGARTFFGERLIAALEEDPACEHIAALDIRPPESGRTKTRFMRLDLTDPTSDEQAAKILQDDGIDVLCHLAFLAHPSHSSSWAHELEAIGSLYIMNAAATAKVPKVVLRSTTAVYGAHAMNPAFLTEKHPLRGERTSRWVMDKVAAERELARLRRDCPQKVCTSLRFGMTVGPTIRAWWGRVLSRQTVVRLMGYDPMMQFLHEDDAIAALMKAVKEDHPGDFNIVGPGTLYYSDVLKLGGRVSVPVPHLLGYSFGNMLFNLQLADAPGTFLNYLRYTWVADDRRMREVMGFTPRYSSREAVEAFYHSLAQKKQQAPAASAGGAV